MKSNEKLHNEKQTKMYSLIILLKGKRRRLPGKKATWPGGIHSIDIIC